MLGRVLFEPVKDLEEKKNVLKAGTLIDESNVHLLEEHGQIRSFDLLSHSETKNMEFVSNAMEEI